MKKQATDTEPKEITGTFTCLEDQRQGSVLAGEDDEQHKGQRGTPHMSAMVVAF